MNESTIDRVDVDCDLSYEHDTHTHFVKNCYECSLEFPQVEKVCEFCHGTGEVSCDERDSDGNWQRGVGTQRCECQLDIEEDREED